MNLDRIGKIARFANGADCGNKKQRSVRPKSSKLGILRVKNPRSEEIEGRE
jgi:hypothetical protein